MLLGELNKNKLKELETQILRIRKSKETNEKTKKKRSGG